MLIIPQSQGILTTFLAYAKLMLYSTAPTSGYLDTYTTTHERIAYMLSIY